MSAVAPIIKNEFFSHSTIECTDKLPDLIANIADGCNERQA